MLHLITFSVKGKGTVSISALFDASNGGVKRPFLWYCCSHKTCQVALVSRHEAALLLMSVGCEDRNLVKNAEHICLQVNCGEWALRIRGCLIAVLVVTWPTASAAWLPVFHQHVVFICLLYCLCSRPDWNKSITSDIYIPCKLLTKYNPLINRHRGSWVHCRNATSGRSWFGALGSSSAQWLLWLVLLFSLSMWLTFQVTLYSFNVRHFVIYGWALKIL